MNNDIVQIIHANCSERENHPFTVSEVYVDTIEKKITLGLGFTAEELRRYMEEEMAAPQAYRDEATYFRALVTALNGFRVPAMIKSATYILDTVTGPNGELDGLVAHNERLGITNPLDGYTLSFLDKPYTEEFLRWAFEQLEPAV